MHSKDVPHRQPPGAKILTAGPESYASHHGLAIFGCMRSPW